MVFIVLPSHLRIVLKSTDYEFFFKYVENFKINKIKMAYKK